VADKRREVFAPARFDEKQVEDDLAHLPDGAATALRSLRRDIDRDGGIAASRLKKCEAEGRDATNLPGCLKTYVPWPDGRYGVVFQIVAHPTRPWGLRMLAYGRRHPTGPGQLSVYQIADRRLIEIIARDLRGKDPGTPAPRSQDSEEQ
jgi:hypothetical protein